LDAHSGTLVVDGTPIAYSGLEPVGISAPNVTINGAADNIPGLKGDTIKLSPDGSGNIVVQDFATGGAVDLAIAETHIFSIAAVTGGTGTVTINGGQGNDTVEFTGDYIAASSNLVVNAETIKVDPSVKLDVGTGNISFNAISRSNGISVLGITTTI